MAVVIGVFAYIALQFAIGIWVSRRIRDEKDYILGGRRLGVTLASFSVFATWFGAETVMGSSGRVYEDGLAGAQGEPFAYAVGIIIMGLFFAAPLWRRGIVTFGDFFRDRFSPRVERLTVILLVPGSVLWAAAQIRGFGQVMSATSTLDLRLAMTIAAAVVIAYTVFGGLLADVYTDLVQGIAIVAGLLAMFVIVVVHTGSPAAMLAGVEGDRLQLIRPDQSLLEFAEQWAIPICGSLVAVELISRILACRSPEVARMATPTGGFLYLGVAMIPVYFGLVGPSLVPVLDEPEQLSLGLAQTLPADNSLRDVCGSADLGRAVDGRFRIAGRCVASVAQHLFCACGRISPRPAKCARRASASPCSALSPTGWHCARAVSRSWWRRRPRSPARGCSSLSCLDFSPRFGGSASAIAAISSGAVVWAAGRFVLDLPTPYLAGLLAATVAYVAVGLLERYRGSRAAERRPDPLKFGACAGETCSVSCAIRAGRLAGASPPGRTR